MTTTRALIQLRPLPPAPSLHLPPRPAFSSSRRATRSGKYPKSWLNLSWNMRPMECLKTTSRSHERFSLAKTERFVRKLFAINTNSKWNGKREREHINAQARIADALGPLLKLWSASQNVLKSKQGQGVDPNDVILYLKATVSLIGNAFFVFLKERRKSMLIKILPYCVDMLEDKKSRKVLKKSREFLFGHKLKKNNFWHEKVQNIKNWNL